MRPPPLLDVPPGHVLRLRRCLYGLRQAGRHFSKKLNRALLAIGLKSTDADCCLFTFVHRSVLLAVVVVWVDDILLSGDDDTTDNIAKQLMAKFTMTDSGQPEFFIGMSIDYDRAGGTMRISQRAHVERMLAKYGMHSCNPSRTPAAVLRLTKPTAPATPAELRTMKDQPYRSMVGALMYLMISGRPDIAFAVVQVARFGNDPRPAHLTAVKRIFRYLKGTLDYSIVYTRTLR